MALKVTFIKSKSFTEAWSASSFLGVPCQRCTHAWPQYRSCCKDANYIILGCLPPPTKQNQNQFSKRLDDCGWLLGHSCGLKSDLFIKSKKIWEIDMLQVFFGTQPKVHSPWPCCKDANYTRIILGCSTSRKTKFKWVLKEFVQLWVTPGTQTWP